MTLHFHGEVTDTERVVLNAAHNETLVAALKDSNDDHIEALNDLVDALLIYAGIEPTGDDEPGHCDNCGEVHLVLNADDLCTDCSTETTEEN